MTAIRKHKHFSKSFSWFSNQGSVLKSNCLNLGSEEII
jgi:hypothetical protein